jgi:hypothetical protein
MNGVQTSKRDDVVQYLTTTVEEECGVGAGVAIVVLTPNGRLASRSFCRQMRRA